MYERHKSEVNVGGNWGAGHVRNGDVIVFEVFQMGVRMRGGTRVMVVAADDGVFGDHPARMWRRDGTGL